jgi:hypothetical protein
MLLIPIFLFSTYTSDSEDIFLSSSTTTRYSVHFGTILQHESRPDAVRTGAAPVATVVATVNGTTVSKNVSVPVVVAAVAAKPVALSTASSTTIQSTVLVFARDSVSAYSAFSGLNAYGIPYQLVVVPQAGITLPVLNSTATAGNYGAIVILSEVSYDYGGTLGFQSALSAAQLAALYAYQAAFGVRMVRLDSFPSADSGTTALGGCCATGQEQTVSISNATGFLTAGLNTSVLTLVHALLGHCADMTKIDGLQSARLDCGTILRASRTRALHPNLYNLNQLQDSLPTLLLVLSTITMEDNR